MKLRNLRLPILRSRRASTTSVSMPRPRRREITEGCRYTSIFSRRVCSTTSGFAESAHCSTIPSVRVAAMDFTSARSANGSRSGCYGWRRGQGGSAESRVAAPILIVGARGRHARGRSEHYPGPCRGADRFRLRRRMGVDSPSRDIKAAPLHCPVMSDWACKHRHAGGSIGGSNPLPLRHRYSAAQKSLKYRRFSNQRLLHGGAPRWSTLYTPCATSERAFRPVSRAIWDIIPLVTSA